MEVLDWNDAIPPYAAHYAPMSPRSKVIIASPPSQVARTDYTGKWLWFMQLAAVVVWFMKTK